MKLLMKLKQKSKRDYLTTLSGFVVTKDEFNIVDDNDRQIQNFILYRNDIEFKELEKVKEELKENPKEELKEKPKEELKEKVKEELKEKPNEKPDEDIKQKKIKKPRKSKKTLEVEDVKKD